MKCFQPSGSSHLQERGMWLPFSASQPFAVSASGTWSSSHSVVLRWGGGQKQKKNSGYSVLKDRLSYNQAVSEASQVGGTQEAWRRVCRHLCLRKVMLRCHRGCRNTQIFTLGEEAPSAPNKGCYEWLDCRCTLAMDTTV